MHFQWQGRDQLQGENQNSVPQSDVVEDVKDTPAPPGQASSPYHLNLQI